MTYGLMATILTHSSGMVYMDGLWMLVIRVCAGFIMLAQTLWHLGFKRYKSARS